MGFRFSRRVKLFPGVRLNVGLRGASVSVGVRGATMNLSKRGVRSTVGIPGTGVSWSSGRSSGRRESSARESRTSAAELRASRVAQAKKQVSESEAQRDAELRAWRTMPALPSPSDYLLAAQPQPWPGAQPELPTEKKARADLTRECEERAVREEPVRIAHVFAGVGALVLGGWIGLSTESLCVALIGAAIGVPLLASAMSNYARRKPVAQRYFADRWSLHWVEVQQRWEQFQNWPELERDRAAFAKRLANGEHEALSESVADSLGDLEFPFETSCSVALPDDQEAYVLLDLPEIEDAIAEDNQRVLKSGEVREVKRAQRDRRREYAELATGLALWVARTTFAAGPTLKQVHVAAYTQRRRPASGELVDDYVYEVAFTRDAAARWEGKSVDPLEALRASPGRLDLRADFQLKAIEPPSWESIADR